MLVIIRFLKWMWQVKLKDSQGGQKRARESDDLN